MAGEKTGGEKFRSSSYNEAQKRIDRLGDLQNRANYHQENREYEQWHSILLNLYKEIHSKLKDSERKNCRKIMEKLATRMGKLMGIKQSTNKLMMPINTNFIYTELFDFDCLLRDLIDKHGFSAPDSEDASEAAYK